jgi:hypothetical protein
MTVDEMATLPSARSARCRVSTGKIAGSHAHEFSANTSRLPHADFALICSANYGWNRTLHGKVSELFSFKILHALIVNTTTMFHQEVFS